MTVTHTENEPIAAGEERQHLIDGTTEPVTKPVRGPTKGTLRKIEMIERRLKAMRGDELEALARSIWSSTDPDVRRFADHLALVIASNPR